MEPLRFEVVGEEGEVVAVGGVICVIFLYRRYKPRAKRVRECIRQTCTFNECGLFDRIQPCPPRELRNPSSGRIIVAVTDLLRSHSADLSAQPLHALDHWPVDRPLLLAHSAPSDSPWSQRSILAAPQTFLSIDHTGASWKYGPALFDVHELATDPLDVLQHALDATRHAPGLWIGYLSYDLGRIIEPTACAAEHDNAAPDDRQWPLLEFAWCPAATINDAAQAESPSAVCGEAHPPIITDLRPNLTRDQYCNSVAHIIDAIAAGDIFQANFTQRFTASFTGSMRQLAVDALRRSSAWFGAYLELPDGRSICSLSPELFLHVDGTSRSVTTRPIKGTRPHAAPPGELLHSEKDIAELTMIIDLMRNDLGRVCKFGSVRVPKPRIIESHAGVQQGVGEVTGVLRDTCTLTDLLRATMPAGSITGAPKIRAMQIIDELETVRRGPYCGAIGVIDPSGNATFNVAIRTMTITGLRTPGRFDSYEHAQLDYSAGGGIIADSVLEAEYQEMLDKTAVLRDAITRFTPRTEAAPESSKARLARQQT